MPSVTFPRMCFDRWPTPPAPITSLTGAQRIALLKANQFAPGTTLRVLCASSATREQRAGVEAACDAWMRVANIDFRPANSARESDVRISFDPTGGAWSKIGTGLLNTSVREATMNLGFDEPGTYLHEFGHTLGAIHEHQSPAAGIRWNKAQVYRDLSGPPNNWDRQTIDHNMFERYSAEQTNASQFDPKSIMLYAFPRTWTTDGFASQPNAELSAADREFMARWYPGRGQVTVTPAATPLPLVDIRPLGDSIARPGERDLFAFDVAAAGGVMIEITPTNATRLVARLFGPNDLARLVAEATNATYQMPWLPLRLKANLSPGRHHVQVSHADEAGTGAYSVRALRLDANDPLTSKLTNLF